MDAPAPFFASYFLWRDPLAVAVLAAILWSFVGVYIVLRRIVFVSAALSQMSGVGVACAFQAIPGAELPWTLPVLGRLTAIMGLSYVAAFLLWTPGGLGIREFLLGLLLAPELAGRVDEEWVAGRVVLAVLLLRVAWTVAELLAAGALYWVPARRTAAVSDAPSLQPSVSGK